MLLMYGVPVRRCVYFVLTDVPYDTRRFGNLQSSELDVLSKQKMIHLTDVCFEAMILGNRGHLFRCELEFWDCLSVLAGYEEFSKSRDWHKINIKPKENRFGFETLSLVSVHVDGKHSVQTEKRASTTWTWERIRKIFSAWNSTPQVFFLKSTISLFVWLLNVFEVSRKDQCDLYRSRSLLTRFYFQRQQLHAKKAIYAVPKAKYLL